MPADENSVNELRCRTNNDRPSGAKTTTEYGCLYLRR